MKKISLAILLAAAILLSGCRNYLDIKPYGKTIPETSEEFSALMQEVLEEIDYGEDEIVGNYDSVTDIESWSDNMEANLTTYPQGNYIDLYIGSHLSSKQLLYQNLYQTIRTCNIILGSNEDTSSDTGRNLTGTAYALRGVCYYDLLRNFAGPCTGNGSLSSVSGVPLVTVFNMEDKPLRNSAAEVAAQIESDLKSSLEYPVTDESYRFTPDVVKGYLARLYFWTGDWSQARTYSEDLLKAHPLLQGDEYKAMMTSTNERLGNMLIKSNIYEDDAVGKSSKMNYMKARPLSKDFVAAFAEGESDIRYGISVGKKRVNAKQPFCCLRSAEMLLIAAESCCHLGNDEEALSLLNDLRSHRISGVTAYTMATLPPAHDCGLITKDCIGQELTPLLSVILDERRKELYMEGDRWYELKRNGRPEFWRAKQGRKYYTREFMYTFPLPVKDILLTDGLEQNPGYENVE